MLLSCLGCTSKPKDVPTSVVETSSFAKLRLGDRMFVTSVLADVFGPSQIEDMKRLVHANPAAFAGPCNLYEQVFYQGADGGVALQDEDTYCVGGIPALNLPMLGSSSALRAGWLAKACVRATNDTSAMSYALRSIYGDADARAPDSSSVVVAFQRFFPAREPPPDVVSALLLVAPNASIADRWRQIFFALCLTPDWQIP